MNKSLIYSLLLIFLLAACTPKAADKTTTDAPQPMPEKETPTLNVEAFRKGVPPAGPAPTIELGQAEQFKLDNGLQVIVVENHKLPRVSFQLYIDAPVISEGETVGTAAMAGQLLTKGTETRTKAQIDEAVDYIGASLSSNENGLFASSLTKHADKLLEVMSDVLLNPAFPEKEFSKAKKQAISALAQEKDNANAIAANVGQVLRYGKEHPYGELTTEKSLEAITVEGAKAYYDNFFKPNIAYLVIVGDVTPEKARSMATTYFGKWAGTSAQIRPSYPEVKKPGETRVNFVDKAGAVQSVINVTYPVDMKPGSADVIPASVMNTAFGGYFRSRLNNNLREDKAYTYGARSALSNDRLAGSFRAYASVRNEVTDSATVQFLHEMRTISTKIIQQEELDIVKSVMSGSFARNLENPETVARFALNTARYDLPADYYANYLTKLDAVTPEVVFEMAQKYITPNNAHILVVGSKDDVAEQLKPFASDGKVHYYDVFGHPLKDQSMEIPAGMTAEKVIQDYINAVGGMDKIKAAKSLKTVMTGESPMGKMMLTTVNAQPNKFAMMIGARGATIQKIVVADGKGNSSGMGGGGPIEGNDLKQLEELAPPIHEAYYLEKGFQLDLKGIEEIEGKKAYKIVVNSPAGAKTTQYFNLSNGLKIRELSTEEGQTTIYDYADYKEVDGLLIPYKITWTGAMPMPITLDVQTAEVNGDISPIFK